MSSSAPCSRVRPRLHQLLRALLEVAGLDPVEHVEGEVGAEPLEEERAPHRVAVQVQLRGIARDAEAGGQGGDVPAGFDSVFSLIQATNTITSGGSHVTP